MPQNLNPAVLKILIFQSLTFKPKTRQMNIKIRLTILSFFQFFVWGAWLITVGNYWFATKQWSGSEFGAIFSTLGLSSILMPALTGIIADKFINAERLFSILSLDCPNTARGFFTFQLKQFHRSVSTWCGRVITSLIP